MRDLDEVRGILRERAGDRKNPFEVTDPAEVDEALAALTSLEPDAWADVWLRHAEAHERAGRHAVAANFYRIARYPAPVSERGRFAHRGAIRTYLAAARTFDPPLERVELPFRGRPGEGDRVIGYLCLPRDATGGLLITWGGIDTYKEERRTDRYLERGIASLAIDMPGVGEAPLKGSTDAERLWDGVLEWANARFARVGIYGGSTGGYWAAKVAHTHADRLACAVDQGGPAHFAFEEPWIRRAQRGEYPFALAETLAFAFGAGSTEDDWVRAAPALSLLRQGVLDRPCCPLLLVNGTRDEVFPISDMHLLLEHGNAKTARFFDGGHMGNTPRTEPLIVEWIAAHLRSEA